MLQTLKDSDGYISYSTSYHAIEITLLCHHYGTTLLYYNLYSDSYFEGKPLTSDPAPFLDIYYVPVKMCGSAVSLVFLPDKQFLLCIL